MTTHWHHHEQACRSAAGTTPEVGDVVTLCGAATHWRVDAINRGMVNLTPLPGTLGHKWRTPWTAHVAHIDVVEPAQHALFDGYAPSDPPPALSPDRRRTARQAAAVTAGRHPLTGGPIHDLASRHRDASAPATDPFTCGSCIHRQVLRHHNRSYPKCVWPGDAGADDYETPGWTPPRFSQSAASDVRAWWPACRDYSPGDTSLSRDAARWVPEVDTTP